MAEPGTTQPENVKAAAHLTEDEIRQRAHAIYLRRNGREGSALEDWLQAEAELRQQDSEQS